MLSLFLPCLQEVACRKEEEERKAREKQEEEEAKCLEKFQDADRSFLFGASITFKHQNYTLGQGAKVIPNPIL